LISQTINNGYDTYDSLVVIAEDEDKAKLIHKLDDKDNDYGSWVKEVESIDIEYLGEAKDGSEAGEVCSSFNAG
jgi:hypothetical protein